MKGLRIKTKTGQILWDSAWTAGVDYDEDDDDKDYDDDNVELPGVEIDEEEEEQLWEDLDENEVADLMNEASSPVQPDPQVGEEDTKEQQEVDTVPVETVDEDEDEDEMEMGQQEEQDPPLRRSQQQPVPVSNKFRNVSSTMGQSYSGIKITDDKTIQYNSDMAVVMATIICLLNEHHVNRTLVTGVQNVVTYTLNKAIKKFGQRASDAALKEMKQLLDRKCFVPIHAHTLMQSERKCIMESLLFLVEKRDGTIKARHCANGSIQRGWISSESAASPTVYTKSVLLSAVIDAEEGRDVECPMSPMPSSRQKSKRRMTTAIA